MAQTIIKINGLREVVRSLNQYAGAVDDMKEANSKISAKVAQDAVSISPKKSGDLARSIKGNRAKEKVQIKAGGTRVPYAGVIEYGWPARNIEAEPYLRRAAYNNIKYTIEQYDANLESLKRKYIEN
jgi:carbon monoxide dehydrogenase subunit G